MTLGRNDAVVDTARAAAENAPLPVSRLPLYFEGGTEPFFGWYHTAGLAVQKDCVAVLCSPLGHEYINSYGSMRHLADGLAQCGIPTVRFDYHGTGDSPGADLDPDRLSRWQADIRTAIQRARALSGRTRVCLIGVRFGATLAALVARDSHVDLVVLWNPCINGRRYLRELQAIAASAERSTVNADGPLESAGFMMSAQTMASIRSIDMLTVEFHAQRVLVVDRDDLAPEQTLCRHYAASGIAHDYVAVPGYVGMMDELPFAIVPRAALTTLINWVAAHSEHGSDQTAAQRPSPLEAIAFPFRSENGITAAIEERLCRFGAGEHLFGILSRNPQALSATAIVLFNAGSVHRVGPNRVYVTLARNLAAQGVSCFRFDLESLGDSVLRSPGREGHPYPDTAIADARTALGYLKQQFGFKRFIVMGLCSGAHTAFHAALDREQDPIAEIILINPLTFYWVEGLSLATSVQFADMASYRKSARTSTNWMRLLRGDVGLAKLTRVTLAHLKTTGKAYLDAMRETLVPAIAPRLSRDLNRLFAMPCQITMVVSDGDPGRDLLMAGAKRTASKGLKTGHIRIHVIPQADHTFSQSAPRKALIDRLCMHVSGRSGEAGNPSQVPEHVVQAARRRS